MSVCGHRKILRIPQTEETVFKLECAMGASFVLVRVISWIVCYVP